MSQEAQGMLIQIEATTAQLRRELASADQVVARTTQQIDRQLGQVDSAFDRTAQKAQQAGNLMRGAFAAIAGAGLIGGIIKQVDSIGQISDRMREATGSAAEYQMVQDRLLQTAKQTYRPLAEAQELYLLTADSIKSMGYNTQQTLDITDSFSYLLVTNSASADKARSALDAYSKALMANKVGVDEWRSILNAMPTVVKAISDSTGKTVEEVKRLGIEGKLSLDDLNKGFLDTVKANQEAAARMRASIGDALININTALGVYLGRAEDSTGAAGALADALGVVADNIEVVAAVVGGVAAGAMAAYTAKAVIATAETLRGIKAAVADRAARIAQADATLQAAIADQRKAQTATILAVREAAAARGTAVQTQMSIQLVQARQREAAATAAVATAQAGLKTASAGLLAVLGGPVGLALMAGTAAASFLLLRDNSGEARISLEEMKRPVQELREEFQGLARDQREAALLRWKDEQARAAEEVKDAYAEMGAALRRALVDQSDARSPGYVQQLQQYQELINRLDQAREAGEDLAPILRDIAASSGIPSETLESLIKQAGALSTSDDKAARLAEVLRVLTADLDANTAAVGSNAAAHGQMSKAASDYIAAIEKRTAAIVDGNDPIKQATRHIEEHGKYTEEEAEAILASAGALKTATDAQARANAATQAAKDAIKAHTAAIDALISKYDPATKAQAEYEKGIALADKALLDGTYTTEQYQKVVQGLYTDLNKPIWDKHNKAVDEAKAKLKQLDDQLDAVRDRLDPVAAASKKLAAEKALLKKGLDAGSMSLEEYQLRLRQLDNEYARNQKSTSQWAQWTESALERVDSAFADAWRNIGDGFSSFRDSLTNAFKQMLAELAHMAITRPIVLQLGAMMGVGNGTQGNNGIWGSLLGGGSGSGGGTSIAGIANQANNVRSLFSMYGTAQSLWPALQGGFANGGFSGALGAAGSYIGSMFGIGSGTAGSLAAGSTASGYTGAAYANWVAAQTANTAATSGLSGMIGNLTATLSNPFTWIAAGAVASWQLNEAGVVPDRERARDAWGRNTSGGAGFLKEVTSAVTTTAEAMDRAYIKLHTMIGIDNKTARRLVSLHTGSPIGQAFTEGLARLFGSGEKYKRTVGSAQGSYSAGEYTGLGAVESMYSGSKRFGDDFDRSLHDLNEAFSSSLGGLFKMFDIDSDIMTTAEARLRRTSGKLAATFTASFDDQAITLMDQYGKKGRIEQSLEQWFDDVMGRGLAQAIGVSQLPEYLKELTEGLTKAAEVSEAVGGLFARFEGVNNTIEALNFSVFEMTDAGLRGADALLDLSAAIAGLEDPTTADKIASLTSLTSTYYDQFFTDAEKAAHTLDAVARAFEGADIVLAESRGAYRAMVEDIDLTTDAGREMFATLMALSGQAATYYSTLEQQLMGGVNSAYSALQRSIANQQREIQQQASSATASINALAGISNALEAALKKLRGSSDDAVRSLRAQAVMTLNSALVTARAGGSLAEFEGLQDALDVASQMDTALYASLVDFEREQERTANLIAELEKVNGKQLTVEQQALKNFESQLSKLDQQLAYAQSQLDALNGIDSSVMSVADAVRAMNASVVAALGSLPKDAAKSNTPANNRSIVDTIYQSVLGRGTAGDEAGASFWANALQAGTATYQDIATSIAKGALANAGESSAGKKSAEQYLKSLGIPGFASGGLFGGGLRIVGERGPELEVTGPSRIYNASQTAAMLNGGGESVAEVRAMRHELSELKAYLYQITKNTLDTARGVRQQIAIGEIAA